MDAILTYPPLPGIWVRYIEWKAKSPKTMLSKQWELILRYHQAIVFVCGVGLHSHQMNLQIQSIYTFKILSMAKATLETFKFHWNQ